MASDRSAVARRFSSASELFKSLGHRSPLAGIRGAQPPGVPAPEPAIVMKQTEPQVDPASTSHPSCETSGNNSSRAAGDGPSPFGSASGGLLALAGPRSAFHVDKRPSGEFVLRHIESGRKTTVSGIDYIRFADLTVHREFLLRSNPDTEICEPEETPAEPPLAEPNGEVATPAPADEAVEAVEADETTAGPVPATPAAASEDQPAASEDGHFEVNDDGSLTITAAQLVAAGEDGMSMRVVALSAPSSGRITDHGDGTWTFIPDGDYEGEVSFDLTLADESGEKEVVRATITIETPDLSVDDETSPPGEGGTASPVAPDLSGWFAQPMHASVSGAKGDPLEIYVGAKPETDARSAVTRPSAAQARTRRPFNATGALVKPLVASVRAPTAIAAPCVPRRDPDGDDGNAGAPSTLGTPEPAQPLIHEEPHDAETAAVEAPHSATEDDPQDYNFDEKLSSDDEDLRLRDLVDRLLERADDILAGDSKPRAPAGRAPGRAAGTSAKPAATHRDDTPANRASEPPAVKQEAPRRGNVGTTAAKRVSPRDSASFENFENFDW